MLPFATSQVLGRMILGHGHSGAAGSFGPLG